MYQSTADELFKFLKANNLKLDYQIAESKKLDYNNKKEFQKYEFTIKSSDDLKKLSPHNLIKLFNQAIVDKPEFKGNLEKFQTKIQNESKFERFNELISKYLNNRTIELDDHNNEGKKIKVTIPKTPEELERFDKETLRKVGIHLHNKIRDDIGGDKGQKLKDEIEISFLTTQLFPKEKKKPKEVKVQRNPFDDDDLDSFPVNGRSGASVGLQNSQANPDKQGGADSPKQNKKSESALNSEILDFNNPYYSNSYGDKILKEVKGKDGFKFEVQPNQLNKGEELTIKTPRVGKDGKDLDPPVFDLIVLDHNGKAKGPRKIISIGEGGKEVELDPVKDKAIKGKSKLDKNWLKSIIPKEEAIVKSLSGATVSKRTAGASVSPDATPGMTGSKIEQSI